MVVTVYVRPSSDCNHKSDASYSRAGCPLISQHRWSQIVLQPILTRSAYVLSRSRPVGDGSFSDGIICVVNDSVRRICRSL
jgi:hypothetical protein